MQGCYPTEGIVKNMGSHITEGLIAAAQVEQVRGALVSAAPAEKASKKASKSAAAPVAAAPVVSAVAAEAAPVEQKAA